MEPLNSFRHTLTKRILLFSEKPDFAFDAITDKVVSILPFPKPVTLERVWQNARDWVVAHRETVLLSAVLLITLLAQGINMFNFPYYEDDEGVYLSQAWSILHQGQLAPYTYWYDHAPFGWIQIAVWMLLTGGTTTFGNALFSGRILMLLIQLVSTLLVYRITRRLSNLSAIAVLAALLFALSPYGLYFHRRILLDNFATLWMLISIELLIVPQRLRLHHIWLSGLAFALSVLSKEVTIFLLPVLGYMAYSQAAKFQRAFAFAGWLAIVSATLSLYVLMAVLKGELFPTGTILGGVSRHVSLLGTLSYQAERGKDGGLFDLHSNFWHMFSVWLSGGSASGEPLLLIGGTLCALISIIFLPKHRLEGCLGVATFSLWLFLARGGLVLEFYFIPLLPLLAMNLALVFGMLAKWLSTQKWRADMHPTLLRVIPVGGVTLALGGLLLGCVAVAPHSGYDRAKAALIWQSPQAIPQAQALNWVQKNVPNGSRIVMDDYMYTDLQEMHKGFALYWHWKVELDPAIHDETLHGDWNNVDYIITTPQLLFDTYQVALPLVRTIFEHSRSLIVFDADHWRIDIRQIIHRHGAVTNSTMPTTHIPSVGIVQSNHRTWLVPNRCTPTIAGVQGHSMMSTNCQATVGGVYRSVVWRL